MVVLLEAVVGRWLTAVAPRLEVAVDGRLDGTWGRVVGVLLAGVRAGYKNKQGIQLKNVVR